MITRLEALVKTRRQAPVSLIVPTYNGSAFLTEALDSVFAQTTLPSEIIVVDDASSDGTGDLVASLARSAPTPLHLIRLERNSGGPTVPLNRGVAAASQDLVAVLDQDDVYLPEKIEEQAELLRRRPDLAFVFSLTGHFDKPDTPMQAPEEIQELRDNGEEEGGFFRLPGPSALRLFMQRGNFVWGYPGFLFRRTDWQRKGGGDESLSIASDYDFLCHLCTRGEVGFIPRIQYLRRMHQSNMTRRYAESHVEVARVKARYLVQERWLLEDQAFSDRLHAEFQYLAWSIKQANYFSMALRCYWMLGRVWGWKRKDLWQFARFVPEWVYRRITGRPPLDTFWTRPDLYGYCDMP
jgi:glycosyltransferase involved in cell wall biosynthesis